MESKPCTQCGEIRPLNQFGPKRAACRDCENARRRAWYRRTGEERLAYFRERYKRLSSEHAEYQDSYYRRNKERIAERNRRKKYGLTEADVQRMAEAQGGVCAICRGLPKSRGFHVDHCHKTGRLRDLLCHSCNTALGLFQDSPALLRAAAKYLENHDKAEVPCYTEPQPAPDR